MSTRLASASLSAALLLAAGGARAQPTQPALGDDQKAQLARQEFEDGQRHYNIQDYAKAIELWKQAYLNYPEPILLFNIGQAYRLAGDCKNALIEYARYESVEHDIKNRAELDDVEAKCRKADAKPDAKAPPDAKPADTSRPIDTSAALRQADLDNSTTAVARAAPPPSTGRGATLKTAGLATGAAGVALVGTGVVFGILAGKDADQITAAKTWSSSLMSTQTAGQRDSTIAGASIAIGSVAIATGVVLYVLGARDHHVEVAVTPSTAGVTWTTGF